jgi:hypothetical protein
VHVRVVVHKRCTLWLCSLLLAMVPACSSTQAQRSEWVLREPVDGRTLQLAVFAGHSSCIDFDGVEVVREESARVEVHAFVTYNGDDVCTDDWGAEMVTVELAQPLGDRQLLGCAGDEIDWHGWNLEPDADCADVRDEHL